MTLFEHSPDCVPLMPCQACQIVSWLRTKLNEEDFNELVIRVNNLGAPVKRKRNRRKPTLEETPPE